jgi:hypothetical protein
MYNRPKTGTIVVLHISQNEEGEITSLSLFDTLPTSLAGTLYKHPDVPL